MCLEEISGLHNTHLFSLMRFYEARAGTQTMLCMWPMGSNPLGLIITFLPVARLPGRESMSNNAGPMDIKLQVMEGMIFCFTFEHC